LDATGVGTGRVTARPSGPAGPWFVDSQAVGAAPLDDEERHWEKPDRGMSLPARAMLVFFLFVAVLGGVAVMGSVLTRDDGRASTATSTMPTTPGDVVLPPSMPATVPPPEPVQPPPVASSNVGIEPELATVDKPDNLVEPPKKVVRPPPNRQWRPKPRRHVEPEQPETKPEEDLYDTR